MKSLGRVREKQDSCEVSRNSLDTNRIAVKSLGRVWIPAGLLWRLYEDSEYQQDSFGVSWKGQRTSKIAAKPLGRV